MLLRSRGTRCAAPLRSCTSAAGSGGQDCAERRGVGCPLSGDRADPAEELERVVVVALQVRRGWVRDARSVPHEVQLAEPLLDCAPPGAEIGRSVWETRVEVRHPERRVVLGADQVPPEAERELSEDAPWTSRRRPSDVARRRAFVTSAAPLESRGTTSNHVMSVRFIAHAHKARSRAFRVTTSTMPVSSNTEAEACRFHSYSRSACSAVRVALAYDESRASDSSVAIAQSALVRTQRSPIVLLSCTLIDEDPGTIPGPATSPGFRLAPDRRADTSPYSCWSPCGLVGLPSRFGPHRRGPRQE